MSISYRVNNCETSDDYKTNQDSSRIKHRSYNCESTEKRKYDSPSLNKRRSAGSKYSANKVVSSVNSSVQNRFLGLAYKNGSPIEIETLDGKKYTGRILGFDTYTVAFESIIEKSVHLFQKHAFKKISCEHLKAEDFSRHKESEPKNS